MKIKGKYHYILMFPTVVNSIIRTFLGNGHDLIKEICVNSDHSLDRNVGNNQHIWNWGVWRLRVSTVKYSKSSMSMYLTRICLGKGHDFIRKKCVNSDHSLDRNVGKKSHIWNWGVWRLRVSTVKKKSKSNPVTGRSKS